MEKTKSKSALDQYISDIADGAEDDARLEEEFRRFDAEPRRTKKPDRTDAEYFAVCREISPDLIKEAADATGTPLDELKERVLLVLRRGMQVDEVLTWLEEEKAGSFAALKRQLEALPPDYHSSPEGRELIWKTMAATPEHFKRELAEELQKAGIYLPCDGGLMEALSLTVEGALAVRVFKLPAMSDEQLACELEDAAAFLRGENLDGIAGKPQFKLIHGGRQDGNDE